MEVKHQSYSKSVSCLQGVNTLGSGGLRTGSYVQNAIFPPVNKTLPAHIQTQLCR